MKKHSKDVNINYAGVDLNKIWKPIHEEIKKVISKDKINVKFVYKDIFKIIDKLEIKEDTWKPNILIFQYVISDMIKYENEIKSFLKNVINKIVVHMPDNSIILFNDINYKSTRKHFEYFYDELFQYYNKSLCKRYHFSYNVKKYYHYGVEHNENCLWTKIPNNILVDYNPWEFCSSAQMIIIKKE